MTARRDPSAADAPVGKPAPAADPPRRYDFAHEVGAVLTAALARDDERRRRIEHCPHCGRPLSKSLS